MAYRLVDANSNSFLVGTVGTTQGIASQVSPVDPNGNAPALAPGNVAWATSADGPKATYRYSGSGSAPAATPTDILVIQGSATKTLRVKLVELGGIATTAGSMPVQLIRRSTAYTGGTAAAQTAGKHDTNDPAATAVVSLFSANPSAVGTSAGVIESGRLWLPLASGQPYPVRWEFSTRQDKALVIRGASDFVAVNFGGAAVPSGGAIDWTIEIEEDVS